MKYCISYSRAMCHFSISQNSCFTGNSVCLWKHILLAILETLGKLSHRIDNMPVHWWFRRNRISLQCGGPGFDPWVRKISWRREWLPTSVFLLGESHGQKSLVRYSPWSHKETQLSD